MFRVLLLTSLIPLSACGLGRERRADAAPAGATRLCVANQAAGYGTQVTVRYPGGRFIVTAGAEECRTIYGPGPRIPVRAVSNGGGSGGPLRVVEAIPTGLGECWRWELYAPTTTRLLRCEEAEEQ